MVEKCSMCGSSRVTYVLWMVLFAIIAGYTLFQFFSPASKPSPLLKSLNESDFQSSVSSGTVLVDFWAGWCGPCRSQLRILNDMAENGKIPDGVRFCLVNVDEESALADRFGIQSIPTMMVFRDGKVIKTMRGVKSEKELLEAVK